MSQVEVLKMSGVRPARRCWVVVGGRHEDEVLVIEMGDVYAVGTVLDDWYVAPAHAVKGLLAKLLKVKEEDILLSC